MLEDLNQIFNGRLSTYIPDGPVFLYMGQCYEVSTFKGNSITGIAKNILTEMKDDELFAILHMTAHLIRGAIIRRNVDKIAMIIEQEDCVLLTMEKTVLKNVDWQDGDTLMWERDDYGSSLTFTKTPD